MSKSMVGAPNRTTQRTGRALAAIIAGGFVVALFSYFAGNVVFGVLATGTWILIPAFVWLGEQSQNLLLDLILWMVRLILFCCFAFSWAAATTWGRDRK